MTTVNVLRVADMFSQRALVTRDSAKQLGNAVIELRDARALSTEIDFSGVHAVTPSFVDELLASLEGAFAGIDGKEYRILFRNTPTRLSSKFLSIARGRGLRITESSPGTWIVTRAHVATHET